VSRSELSALGPELEPVQAAGAACNPTLEDHIKRVHALRARYCRGTALPGLRQLGLRNERTTDAVQVKLEVAAPSAAIGPAHLHRPDPGTEVDVVVLGLAPSGGITQIEAAVGVAAGLRLEI
jgi:hypothetical protein